MRVMEAIAGFLKRHGMEGQPVCVGFSGGADSTALLLALHQCGCQVTAYHFHHGLRGEEADADAEWCRRFCESRGIPFELHLLDVPGNRAGGESCEACGRRLRLERWRKVSQGRPVFLAHHADDFLEELFLRLARGANASSLVPMKESREIHGVTFMRPLLEVRRREIEVFLTAQGIRDWRIDSTNLESEVRRNAVRNRLLPLAREIFGSDAGFLQALHALRQDAACLDRLADAAYASGLSDIAAWRRLEPAIFARCALRRIRESDADAQLSHDAIQRLQDAVAQFDGRQLAVPLPGGRMAYVASSGIVVEPVPWEDREWNWRQEPVIRLGGNLCLSVLAGGGGEARGGGEAAHGLAAVARPPTASQIAGDAGGSGRAGEGGEAALGLAATAMLSAALQEDVVPGKAGEGALSERFGEASLPDVLLVRHWREGDRMIPFGGGFSKKLKELFQEEGIPRYLRGHLPVLEANGKIIWVPGVRRAEFGRVLEGTPFVVIAIRALDVPAASSPLM